MRPMEEKQEFIQLLKQAHDGDKEARDRLVTDNVGLVWSSVRHFNGRGDPEDLFQIGCIGLIKAIDKFNLDFDVRFSTYAVPMITGEIRRFLRDDGMVKVSRSLRELGIRVRALKESMTGSLGREPTLEELSKELGISREEIAASLEAGAEVESLYRTVGNGEDQNLCLLDRLPDERQEQEEMMNRLVLKQLLLQLSEKDRDIIVRRYFENQTQSRIAAELHISQVQVSRLEKKILRQMREYLEPS